MIVEKVFLEDIEHPYNIKLHFSNGEIRRANMQPLVEQCSYLKRLKNVDYFRKNIRTECGGVVWDDDTDISPSLLYKNSVKV